MLMLMCLVLLSLCICLIMTNFVCLFSVEMFIPYYTGRVIDILGAPDQQSEFLPALLFMGLYSVGGYGKMFSLHIHTPACLWWCSLVISNFLFGSFISSVSVGCRGGLFLCGMSSFICRIKLKLFQVLTKQEIGFFETTKTGKVLIV